MARPTRLKRPPLRNTTPGLLTTPPEPRRSAETVVLAAAVLLLVGLSYATHAFLSPFVIAGALVFLLYPWRQNPVARRLLWLGVMLFTLWFVRSILGILVPFLLAFLIAYILNPFVTFLERRKLPRLLSSVLAVLLMIGIAVTAALFLLPPAIRQFEGIINALTLIVHDFVELLNSGVIFRVLEQYGIPLDRVREIITTQLSPKLEGILKALLEGVFGFVTSISSLALHLINIIIIPFLVFYLLKDFPVVTHRLSMLVPRERRERFVAFGALVNTILGQYLRGAIIVAALQGTIAGVALWFIGVDYPLVLGIMTGILNFIPYVGLLTSLVVASIVASFSGEPVLLKVAGVIILFLSQKLLEATVFGPKIVGSQVGLHPVLLILCLLVFGYFLGFIGLLIAVPATALILASVREWETARGIRTGVSPE